MIMATVGSGCDLFLDMPSPATVTGTVRAFRTVGTEELFFGAAGATVTLRPTDPAGESFEVDASGADGAFLIDEIPEGSYSVSASFTDGLYTYAFPEYPSFTVEEGASVTLNLLGFGGDATDRRYLSIFFIPSFDEDDETWSRVDLKLNFTLMIFDDSSRTSTTETVYGTLDDDENSYPLEGYRFVAQSAGYEVFELGSEGFGGRNQLSAWATGRVESGDFVWSTSAARVALTDGAGEILGTYSLPSGAGDTRNTGRHWDIAGSRFLTRSYWRY